MDSPKPTRIEEALQWLEEEATEKVVTAARIFGVSASTLRTYRSMARHPKPPSSKPHGGNNRILSDAQIEVIRKYIADSYYAGFPATKQMVYSAVCLLRRSEMPPQEGAVEALVSEVSSR